MCVCVCLCVCVCRVTVLSVVCESSASLPKTFQLSLWCGWEGRFHSSIMPVPSQNNEAVRTSSPSVITTMTVGNRSKRERVQVKGWVHFEGSAVRGTARQQFSSAGLAVPFLQGGVRYNGGNQPVSLITQARWRSFQFRIVGKKKCWLLRTLFTLFLDVSSDRALF